MGQIIDFQQIAADVGYVLKDLPDDTGYIPAPGETVAVHTPEGAYVGDGTAIMLDPSGPYMAVRMSGYVISVHLADLRPSGFRDSAA